MTVDEMSACTWALGIVRNRVKFVNAILGYGSGLGKSPCKCTFSWGRYRVRYCDAEVASFSPYVISEIEDCIAKLDGIADGLWYGLGGGVIGLGRR